MAKIEGHYHLVVPSELETPNFWSNHLGMGTLVLYTHRAAVARFTKRQREGNSERGWRLFEGVSQNELMPGLFTSDLLRFKYFGSPPVPRLNKSVIVWPSLSSGIIIGGIKRGIGESQPGYGGGEEWEPGYLDLLRYVNLYLVKTEFRSTEYILVPTWAVTSTSQEPVDD